MTASGRFCCKSRFALVTENSAGRGRGFRVKMRGTSSPRDKLTGDFGNAIEVIRIGDYFPFRLFAKNLWPCNFRVLQQNRPTTDVRRLPRVSADRSFFLSQGLRKGTYAVDEKLRGPAEGTIL